MAPAFKFIPERGYIQGNDDLSPKGKKNVT